MRSQGRVEVITGPTNSGKSTEFLRRVRRHLAVGRTVILVRPALDTRDGVGVIATHDGVQIPCWNCTSLMTELRSRLENCPVDSLNSNEGRVVDVIGIDEGQFFPDLHPFSQWAASKGVIVIGALLNMTFLGEPFSMDAMRFICTADKVKKFNGVCSECRSEYGSFSYNTHDSSEGGGIIQIGSHYIPLCRSCYNRRYSTESETKLRLKY